MNAPISLSIAKFHTFVTMKFMFYILFACYFISLTVLPCTDADACNDAKCEQTSNGGAHHEAETCSPFCVCSCCAVHFVIKTVEPMPKQVAVIQTVYTIHKETKTTPAITPIWQPPRLA